MNFRNIFFISFLCIQLYAPQATADTESDVVRTENHHSNLELYEFINLTALRNAAIFHNENAKIFKLRCTLFKGQKLRIVVIEDETPKSQFLDMVDCSSQVSEVLEKMIKNPLEHKVVIVPDDKNSRSGKKLFKFSFKDLSETERSNYIDAKLKVTLEEVIL